MTYVLKTVPDAFLARITEQYYTGRDFVQQGEKYAIVNDYGEAKHYKSKAVAEKVKARLDYEVCNYFFAVVESHPEQPGTRDRSSEPKLGVAGPRRIRLNPTERTVYEGLVAISSSVQVLESAVKCMKTLKKPELERVLSLFNGKIEEYEYRGLLQSAYDAQSYADTLLEFINEMMNPEIYLITNKKY